MLKISGNLKAKVTKKRTVATYAELWHGSKVLLERAKAETVGSYWLIMASILYSAFALEAYLNHVGPKLLKTWDLLEKLPPTAKLGIVCEVLEINVNRQTRPFATIHELFKFRNLLAHGKTVQIEEHTVRDVDQYLDEFLGARPLATWEKFCTEKNVIRVRGDVEEVIRLVHSSANLKDDVVFFTGLSVHSAEVGTTT